MKSVCFDAALAAADACAADGPGAPIRIATPGHLTADGASALMALVAERYPGRCISVESRAAGMQYGFVPSNVKA